MERETRQTELRATLGGGIRSGNGGFTLIEMSIVLVVIGLIVGGVLVGQDLIRAAYVRAQISQIEKYNTAVNTFYGKYQALPGDMNYTTAAEFGFQLTGYSGGSQYRGEYGGDGDGNGILQGYNWAAHASSCGWCVGAGELVVFWDDISYANGMKINLIEGSFPPPQGRVDGNPDFYVVATAFGLYYPAAKIGGGNYVYVYSYNNINYFGVSVVSAIANWGITSTLGLSVNQAYNLDKKVDDGLPQSGHVIAQYVANSYAWSGPDNGPTDTTTPTPPSPSSCYDDGGVTGTMRKYSVSENGGNSGLCALSFQMQGGD
jgi:prepilin-type N-terminal cleavage/methylation domain-containing protein